MASHTTYTDRELEQRFKEGTTASDANRLQIMAKLDDLQDVLERRMDIIEVQTTAHNHRMSKIEKWLLVVGTASAVTLLLKFPELAPLFHFI